MVGIFEGVDVGPCGVEVGVAVGGPVGLDVGESVGDEVGLAVGSPVGLDVSESVGDEVVSLMVMLSDVPKFPPVFSHFLPI